MRPNEPLLLQLRAELTDGLKHGGNSQSPFVRRLAARYAKVSVRSESADLIATCEELMKSKDTWQQMIACVWLHQALGWMAPDSFDLFESWLHQYVFSWGTCDDYCRRVLNPCWEDNYELFPRILKWTVDTNKWVRRASAVIFIKAGGGGSVVTTPTRYLFEVADRLMRDSDLHVQKGLGWMLKAASANFQTRVYKYVVNNRQRMTRTAYRYAIRNMPEELRQRAMER